MIFSRLPSKVQAEYPLKPVGFDYNRFRLNRISSRAQQVIGLSILAIASITRSRHCFFVGALLTIKGGHEALTEIFNRNLFSQDCPLARKSYFGQDERGFLRDLYGDKAPMSMNKAVLRHAKALKENPKKLDSQSMLEGAIGSSKNRFLLINLEPNGRCEEGGLSLLEEAVKLELSGLVKHLIENCKADPHRHIGDKSLFLLSIESAAKSGDISLPLYLLQYTDLNQEEFKKSLRLIHNLNAKDAPVLYREMLRHESLSRGIFEKNEFLKTIARQFDLCCYPVSFFKEIISILPKGACSTFGKIFWDKLFNNENPEFLIISSKDIDTKSLFNVFYGRRSPFASILKEGKIGFISACMQSGIFSDDGIDRDAFKVELIEASIQSGNLTYLKMLLEQYPECIKDLGSYKPQEEASFYHLALKHRQLETFVYLQSINRQNATYEGEKGRSLFEDLVAINSPQAYQIAREMMHCNPEFRIEALLQASRVSSLENFINEVFSLYCKSSKPDLCHTDLLKKSLCFTLEKGFLDLSSKMMDRFKQEGGLSFDAEVLSHAIDCFGGNKRVNHGKAYRTIQKICLNIDKETYLSCAIEGQSETPLGKAIIAENRNLISLIKRTGKLDIREEIRIAYEAKSQKILHKILSESKDSRKIALNHVPEALEYAIHEINIKNMGVDKEIDVMPKPHKDVMLDGILCDIPDTINENDKASIRTMVDNITKRNPLPGMPIKETDPEGFEQAYARFERQLKVLVIAINEIKAQYRDPKTTPKDKKDRKEVLESLYKRFGEFGGMCARAYSEQIPLMYQSEILPLEYLECVQKWKKDPVAIPLNQNPEENIRKHQVMALYPYKVNILKEVFHSLYGHQGNVHDISGFMKYVSKKFHLHKSNFDDPLAGGVGGMLLGAYDFWSPYVMKSIEEKFAELASPKSILDAYADKVPDEGGEANPYIQWFANKEIDLSDVFDIEEDDDGDILAVKGLNRAYAAYLFWELGFAK